MRRNDDSFFLLFQLLLGILNIVQLSRHELILLGNFLVFPAKTAQVISLLAIIIAAVLYILLRKQKAPVINSDIIDLSTLNPVTSEQAGKASPHPLHDAGEESDAAEHPETQHAEGSAGADTVDSNECSNDEK